MGMSDKKTTSTQNTSGTFNQTSTPNVPSWISDPAQAMAGQVGAIQAQGPAPYTPTASPLQTQVQNDAASFTPNSNYSDASTGFSGIPQVQGQSLLTNLQDYLNPGEQDVINPVLADYDVQAGKTTAAQAAAAAGNRAFQGSRYGVQEAATTGELARGRAATEGGLLQTNYQTALQASQADAAARQAAMTSNQGAGIAKAQGLLGIDTAKNAEQLAALQAQDTIGQQATATQQQQQQYPLTFANQTEGLLSGLNPSLFTGSTSSGNTTGNAYGVQNVSDPLGEAAQLMKMAAGFAGA